MIRRLPAYIATGLPVATLAWLVTSATLDAYGVPRGTVIGWSMCLLAGWGAGAIVGELVARRDIARRERARRCSTCGQGTLRGVVSRETGGVICHTCLWDAAVRKGRP